MLKCSRIFAVVPSLLLLSLWQIQLQASSPVSIVPSISVSVHGPDIIFQRAIQRQEAPNPTHTVKKGETLWGISRNHGASIDELKKLNGLEADNPVIVEGQKLKLPSGTKPLGVAKPKNDVSTPAKRPETKDIIHTVASGETLFRIAQKHGVSVDALQQANQITDPATIRVGAKLRVPGVTAPKSVPTEVASAEEKPTKSEVTAPEPKASQPVPEVTQPSVPPKLKVAETVPAPPDRQGKAPAGYGIYVVQPGDTTASIAKTYGITTRDLLRINRVTHPNYQPQVGEFVMVPSDGSWYVPKASAGAQKLSTSVVQVDPPAAPTAPKKPTGVNHNLVKIGPNDSLEALARRYETTSDQIKLDNPKIKSNRDLRVGMELKIRSAS